MSTHDTLTPAPDRRRTPVRDSYPLPTYPFAPGTIEGPAGDTHQLSTNERDYWRLLGPSEIVGVVILVAIFALLGGLIVRWLA